MLRVLYNGRASAYVPPFARLDALGDFRNWGMTRTTAPDYNHAHWSRSIVWRKGKYFLVFDEIIAADAGDFVFDLGYRLTSWPVNRQRMTDPRTFLAEHNLPKSSGAGYQVVDDPQAANGKALEFLDRNATVAFDIFLLAGPAKFQVHGRGQDTAHDSVWVRVDGQKTACGYSSIARYGGGLSEPVTIEKNGMYSVTLQPREAAPTRLDRITVHHGDAEGKTFKAVQTLEAEDLPGIQEDTTARFVIQSADRVGMLAHDEWVDRLRRNRMYIRQRRSAELRQGESRSFASLLVPTAAKRPGSYALKRVGPQAFVVTGDEPAFILFGKFQSGNISIDATCAMVSPGEVAGTQIKTFQVEGLSLPAGDANMALDRNPNAQRAVQAALDHLTALPEKPENEPGEDFRPIGFPLAGKPLPPAWQADFPAGEARITGLQVADLDQDGTPEILAARGNMLYCLTPQGKVKWEFKDQRKFNDVTVGKFRQGKTLQVLAGGDGEYLHILDAAGTSLSKVHYNGDKTVVNNFINAVTAADINGDGMDEALAGGRDWQFHLYNADLKELFRRGGSHHGVTAIRCSDVDGDGRKEVFVADRYGAVNGFRLNPDMTEPEYIFHRYTSIGDIVCDVGDIDGDKKGEVVHGASGGEMIAAKPDKNFDVMMFRFDNFGYGVSKLLIEDMNGNGAGEVLVGSMTGYLYVLDGRAKGEGHALLAHKVGRGVMDLAVVTRPGGEKVILAGDVNGRIIVVNLTGKELFSAQTPGSVFHVAALPVKDGAQVLLAGTADGGLLAYQWLHPAQ